jgi:hypothetical protein
MHRRQINIAILGALGSGKTWLTTAIKAFYLTTPIVGVVVHLADDPQLNSIPPQKNQTRAVFDLTLVCGLDLDFKLPQQHQSTAMSRELADIALRTSLMQRNMTYTVVYGEGQARLACAIRAITAVNDSINSEPNKVGQRNWQWSCENCSDPSCEHAMFTGLITSEKRERY